MKKAFKNDSNFNGFGIYKFGCNISGRILILSCVVVLKIIGYITMKEK